MKLTGSCHCGAEHLEVASKPRVLKSCNCSLCRRYASLMAYFPPAKVSVSCDEGALDSYLWGDQCIRFFRCASCGCFLYWQPVDPAGERMGVNFRNFDPAVVASIRVRRFDGADTWKYLD